MNPISRSLGALPVMVTVTRRSLLLYCFLGAFTAETISALFVFAWLKTWSIALFASDLWILVPSLVMTEAADRAASWATWERDLRDSMTVPMSMATTAEMNAMMTQATAKMRMPPSASLPLLLPARAELKRSRNRGALTRSPHSGG